MDKEPVDQQGTAEGIASGAIIGNWHLLLTLFILFRVFALVFFRPGGFLYGGASDFLFYRQIGEFSLEGHYPYLDYWFEYPPIFPWVVVGLYRLALLLPPPNEDLFWFQMAVSSFLLVCDTINLVLIYHLAKEVWGPVGAFRSALIYAALFWPLFIVFNWFDAFPLLFLLLAIWLTVRRRYWLAGLAAGFGFMVKIFPVIAAPAALRYAKNRQRVVFLLACLGAALLVALPFLVTDYRWLVAGFQSTLTRSSWETIWALAEGFYGYGLMPPLPDRFNLAEATWMGHPSNMPWLLIDGVFLVSCGLLFLKRPTLPWPKAVVAAVALTLNLFLFFSKGYSPQYLVYVLALLVILLPNGWGIAYAAVLTATNLVEFPIYFLFLPYEHWILWITVLVRTAVLVLLSVEYATLLFGRGRQTWRRLQRQFALPAALLLVVIFVVGAGLLVQGTMSNSQAPEVVTYMRQQSIQNHALVASSRGIFYQLKPYFQDDAFLLGEADSQTQDMLDVRLMTFNEGKSQVWLLLDYWGDTDTRFWLVDWYSKWGARVVDRWFGSWELIEFVPSRSTAMPP